MPKWLTRSSAALFVTAAYFVVRVAVPREDAIPAPLSPAEYAKWHRNATKMWEGPLGGGTAERSVGEGVRIWLSHLPNLADLGPDGIRLIVWQYGQEYVVALSLASAEAREAKGVLVVVDHRQPGKQTSAKHPFNMPAREFRSMMGEFDKLADNWPGSDPNDRDGIGCIYERIRGRRITSGVDGFGARYEKMQVAVLRHVSAYAGVPYIPSYHADYPMRLP